MQQKLLFTFKKTSSPVSYCVLSIGMGTRDEDPKYNGLAHLTEHMLFKGTSKRSSVKINSTLEKVGGDLNAYTTKERIVVYSTTLKEDIAKAMELIFEVAFDSRFPENELKKEKGVVYDEIITYQDSPTELLYDTFECELFTGTPLGFSILGDKGTLEPITPAILKSNLDKYFTPENMTLTIAGDFDEKKIAELVDTELHKWKPDAAPLRCGFTGSEPAGFIPSTSRPYLGECDSAAELAKGNLFNKQTDKKLRQAHCIMGCSAYSYYNLHKRAALSLLTNILGGPAINSRLSLLLREKYGLVYNVEASYVSYKDCGVFSIYFGCEKEYLERCKQLIIKEIRKLIDEPLTPRRLHAAKKQMFGQLSIAGDNVEAQCLTTGKSLLMTGRGTSMEQIRAGIDAVTAEELQQTAREVLDPERLSSLIFF